MVEEAGWPMTPCFASKWQETTRPTGPRLTVRCTLRRFLPSPSKRRAAPYAWRWTTVRTTVHWLAKSHETTGRVEVKRFGSPPPAPPHRRAVVSPGGAMGRSASVSTRTTAHNHVCFKCGSRVHPVIRCQASGAECGGSRRSGHEGRELPLSGPRSG